MSSSNCVEQSSQQDDKAEVIEDEFMWQDYLEATNSVEVPHTLFMHVEESLQSGFQEGMKLEVPVKESSEAYWAASIVMACGPLLRLMYVGDKDRSKEFWCDLTKITVHPVGWCEANGKTLVPPDHLKDVINVSELKLLLEDSKTVPAELLSGEGCTPVDRIKQGVKVEVQCTKDPYRLWIATIVENVGGRLLLRYDSPDSNTQDFWLFYSSPRIFPVGWAERQGAPWVLRKPIDVQSKYSEDEWDAVLERSKDEIQSSLFPADILNKIKKPIPRHYIEDGMKVEAVHPVNMAEICPATVIKVFDNYYFLVAIDIFGSSENSNSDLTWLATLRHPYIFPVGWAKENNIKLTHPQGWTTDKEEFDWSEYLDVTGACCATLPEYPMTDHGLELTVGMKLEAVNPDNNNQICVATIEKFTKHLLWLRLDSTDSFQHSHVRSIDSLEIFPVGWCEGNSYPLKAPQFSLKQSVKPGKEEDQKESSQKYSNSNTETKSCWCPKLYFNHKCFSGPFLSKGKLAQLPKAVGPGPVTLVLKEVLSMLISVAYMSSRVLKELQISSKPKPGMHLEVLKAKYKTNVYRATVELVTSSDKVPDFCKDVCRRLQVCPYLFGPVAVGEKSCPENCHTMSKTRFLTTSTASTQSVLVGRRKAGRPPDSMRNVMCNNLFSWPRRTLQKDYMLDHKRRDDLRNDGDELPAKRMRYETRGIKLPNFGLIKHHNKNTSSSETSSLSSNPSTNRITGKRRGRRTKAEMEKIRKEEEFMKCTEMDDKVYTVDTNPLLWTVEDVYQYMKRTHDCRFLANLLRDEEFDGKSFMLLNLPSCVDNLKLNQVAALNLCRHVEAVKFAFFCKYVRNLEEEDC